MHDNINTLYLTVSSHNQHYNIHSSYNWWEEEPLLPGEHLIQPALNALLELQITVPIHNCKNAKYDSEIRIWYWITDIPTFKFAQQ